MIKNTSRGTKYLAGLSTGYIVTIVTVIVSLWLIPFTLRYLNREEYAIFTLAGDMLMWLGLLDLGLSSGLNAQAAQIVGKNDQDKLDIIASSAFFAQAAVSLLFVIIGIGLSFGFVKFFSISPALATDAKNVVIILSISSGLTMLTQTFSSLLIAHQQNYVDNVIRLILIFIRTLITVILLMKGFKILSIAYANLAAVVLTTILYIIRTRILLPGLKIRWENFSKESLKSTFNVGIWFFLGGIAGLLITQFDRIVTAKILTLELVTVMTLTGRIYALSNTFIQQITSTMKPVMGQNLGKGALIEARTLYHQTNRLSSGIAIIVSMAIWSSNIRFINWWVGPINYGGWQLDLAFALSLIVSCWVLPNRAILAASMKYLPQHAIARFIEGFINLGLSIWLGKLLGIQGIILGTVFAGLLVSVWFLPWLTAKLFQQSFFKLIIKDNLRLIIFGVFLLGISTIFRYLSNYVINDFLAFFITSVSIFLIGMACLWLCVFEEDLKYRIKVTIRVFFHSTSHLFPRRS